MFFNQDILGCIGETDDKPWTLYLITDKARDFMRQRVRKLWGDVRIKTLPGDLQAVTIDAKRGGMLFRSLRRTQKLDIYVADPKWNDISPEMVELSARAMADEARARATRKAICDLLIPLIEDAIAAKDKLEITKLFRQLPSSMVVEKATLLNRLQFEHFPELKEKGVTLDNWHKAQA